MGGLSVVSGQRILIGVGAIVSSGLYVVSDAVELAVGGLSTGQLVVTYLAEALIPLFLIGLHSIQHPMGGWLSLLGALLYGFAFVGFSATVLYPLVTGSRDADDVFDDFGGIYTVHAVLALIGGVAFAFSVLRAQVYPTWTGYTLAAGLLLTAVFVLLGMSEEVQTVGTAVRSVAFAGMGIVCLRVPERAQVSSVSSTIS